MDIREKKKLFEENKSSLVYESHLLTFKGVDGFDVYNCSVPFEWEGKTYMYGRVEKREQWANSVVRLFEKTGEDSYNAVYNHMIYPLEDPFISIVQGEFVLGGTHVRKRVGNLDTYYGYFYRGKDINDLNYFTTGPDYMKDIRLVDLRDGRIGVFSRPRNDEITKKYGSGSMIGFTTIRSLDELTDDVIFNAEPVMGIFGKDEWGGCNQPILLENGNIGVIGHQSYNEQTENGNLSVYVNIAFELNPDKNECCGTRVIGTRSCYPDGPAKRPGLIDCTFTSGIVSRTDGKADLYGGMSDISEGRIVIDYPFSAPEVK